MAIRRRKKKQIDEGPFLFSEEEMSGMITNVAIIETPIHAKVVVSSAPETSDEEPLTLTAGQQNEAVAEIEHEERAVTVSVQTADELSSDERIVLAMTNVLWQMKHMDKSKIRGTAFSITVMCQQGLDLNRTYSVPVIQEDEMSGYELAAWCYCTFVSAFPSMQDKLQLPYAEHYNKAKERLNLN